METIADWYAVGLRPKLDRAARRGDVPRSKVEKLERLMADLAASERLARTARRRGRATR